MRRQGPFDRSDLHDLGQFFNTAHEVVSMREVLAGNHSPHAIAVRHDVDNHSQAFATALQLARWEAEWGWRSTYFLLHTARYWKSRQFLPVVEEIASLGHEIGLHVDALAHALQYGGDPHEMVFAALQTLRDAGHVVTGVVGHGNQLCHLAHFANDEQFVECVRDDMGAPDRELRYQGRAVKIEPRPLSDFGLEYEAIGLRMYEGFDGLMRTRPYQLYNTDSGCRWYYPFEETVEAFQNLGEEGQLHLLIHPDHWSQAFVTQEVAA